MLFQLKMLKMFEEIRYLYCSNAGQTIMTQVFNDTAKRQWHNPSSEQYSKTGMLYYVTVSQDSLHLTETMKTFDRTVKENRRVLRWIYIYKSMPIEMDNYSKSTIQNGKRRAKSKGKLKQRIIKPDLQKILSLVIQAGRH